MHPQLIAPGILQAVRIQQWAAGRCMGTLGFDGPGTMERSVKKLAENTWATGLQEPSTGT